MKEKNKFINQVENIIKECEEQIKDLEEIVEIKNTVKSEEDNKQTK
ncbi:MAG: hypothetical protein L3J56_03820 [Bacteroidales bacterium]|nr:hypothetical protein [Bacteroidales bacterium]